MLLSLMSNNQKNEVSNFKNKTKSEQLEMIANKCNELGISKSQLAEIISYFK
jgi:DNA-binding transcriptional regulator YhcF (GntR family)